jgi:Flp pilus assembly pilin Flp
MVGEASRKARPSHSEVQRMDSVRQSLNNFLRDEDGQDVVEYGLLIATIAIVVLVATTLFGGAIRDWFTLLAGRITTNT